HFAARHFQIVGGGVEVRAYANHFRVDRLHVIRSSLGGQFAMHGSIESRQFFGCVVVQLGGLFARLAQLALGDLQLIGDHFQVALQIGVGLFVLCQTVLHRGD